MSDFLKSTKKMSKVAKKNANKKARRLVKVAQPEVLDHEQVSTQGCAPAPTPAPAPTQVPAIPNEQNVKQAIQLSSRIPDDAAVPQINNQSPHVSLNLARLFADVISSSSAPTEVQVKAVQVPPVFKTPGPEGPYRDEIVVEILSLNGQTYASTVTPTKPRKIIYEEVLGMTQDNLASITIGFNRGRIITFKLRKQVDVDKLYAKEFFEFERSIGQDVCIIECKIR